jgi:hypothetical protein
LRKIFNDSLNGGFRSGKWHKGDLVVETLNKGKTPITTIKKASTKAICVCLNLHPRKFRIRPNDQSLHHRSNLPGRHH